MKTGKKVFVYFIALILTLIYYHTAKELGINAVYMAGIAGGLLFFGLGFLITEFKK